MKNKPILIVPGEPNSIIFEIFFKCLVSYKFKSPIIVIGSQKILKLHMKKLKYNLMINLLDVSNIHKGKLDNKKINLIEVNYDIPFKFGKISNKSKKHIDNCFKIAFNLIEKKITNKLINGPISKRYFLKKKYLGVTEYIANYFKIKNFAMLIYNKNISVCPITTHLPLKFVPKKINKQLIEKKIKLINFFYRNYLKKKPKFAVTGLNPHCESISKFNEDEKIIFPSVKNMKKKGINVHGPLSADTLFLKKNRSKYNVIVGMYHDQVLTPMKTLFEFDAINITLGLPFIRVSPDHGPNENMVGKNLSNPTSLLRAIQFLDN